MGEEKQLRAASKAPIVSDAAIVRWGEALEQKDPGTWTHCKQVEAFAMVLAQALKLDKEEVRAIACGALLHEIGKLEIPDAILRKPAVLTAEERLIMRGAACAEGWDRRIIFQTTKRAVRLHNIVHNNHA